MYLYIFNCVCVVGPGNEIVCGCALGTVPSNMICGMGLHGGII